MNSIIQIFWQIPCLRNLINECWNTPDVMDNEEIAEYKVLKEICVMVNDAKE